jgi:hypothetical protein
LPTINPALKKTSALIKEKKYTKAKKLLSPIQKPDKSFEGAQYYLSSQLFCKTPNLKGQKKIRIC